MADFERLIIKKYRFWTLYLSEQQSYLGRCYLALNRTGKLDPFVHCTMFEWIQLLWIIRYKLVPGLSKVFSPDMLNYDYLCNAWPRCQWHVVPRYSGLRLFHDILFEDNNWGKNWSPYDKGFLVPEEVLMEIRDIIA